MGVPPHPTLSSREEGKGEGKCSTGVTIYPPRTARPRFSLSFPDGIGPDGDGGIVIDGIPWIKDIGMAPEDHLHLTFQNEDKFLAFMDRGLRCLDGGGSNVTMKGSMWRSFLSNPKDS